MKTKFKINTDKIYKIIGQTVVYVTFNILLGIGGYLAFLQGMTY